jgi:hypothetical protein
MEVLEVKMIWTGKQNEMENKFYKFQLGFFTLTAQKQILTTETA